MGGELVGAEDPADLFVRMLVIRHREGHRHVQIVGAGCDGRPEDGGHEPRIAGVEDHVHVLVRCQLGDGG